MEGKTYKRIRHFQVRVVKVTDGLCVTKYKLEYRSDWFGTNCFFLRSWTEGCYSHKNMTTYIGITKLYDTLDEAKKEGKDLLEALNRYELEHIQETKYFYID